MTNTKELKKLMAEELARVADGFSDEEIIGGCAFTATVEFEGKTYKATTDYTDHELEAGASEKQIVELLDRLIAEAVENIEQVNALTAEEVIDEVMAEVDENESQIEQLQSVLNVLGDGEALANLGFNNDDQEAIEEAYDIIKNRIVEANSEEWSEAGQNEIYVLDFQTFTVEKMSEAQFIKDYSRCVPTPFGVAPEFQYDPETREVIRWICGQYRQVVYGNCSPEFAHKELFKWALMDAWNDGIETARTKEEAVEFIDNFVKSCYDPEEDAEFIEKYNAMKDAL